MDNTRKLQEEFQVEEGKVIKKQEIEVTYDLEDLYFERENLLRDRLFLIQENTNLKKQYELTMQRLDSIEEMIKALSVKDVDFTDLE